MTIRIENIRAKSISYSNTERDKAKVVKYIVIHNTGNKNDTAENNGIFFQRSNTRQAGAHFFVDRAGVVVKSIPMNRTAWAVGGNKLNVKGGGKLYGKVTNANSVSIELCGIVDREPTPLQIEATRQLIQYIRKYCPNATEIVRHFDVTGKSCPAIYTNNKKWKAFKEMIEK